MGTPKQDDGLRQKRQATLPLTVIQPGRIAADQAVARWLRQRGLPSTYRPRARWSQQYCGWLARTDRRRAREVYDALVQQRWLCWVCGANALPQTVDLHHAEGYEGVEIGNEDPSQLRAVHRYRCHRRAHDELKRQSQAESCGCQLKAA